MRMLLEKAVGLFLLFLTYVFLWVAGGSILLLQSDDNQGFIVIGTSCLIAANGAYAARMALKDHAWERLYITALAAILAMIFATWSVANEEKITIYQAVQGFINVMGAASALALMTTVVHWFVTRKDKKQQELAPSA